MKKQNLFFSIQISQESLAQHMKYVHEKAAKPYLCDKCDKSFRSNKDLLRHMNYSHEGGKEFQCDICDYNASTPQNLTQHKISGLSICFYPKFIEILSKFYPLFLTKLTWAPHLIQIF